MTRQKEGWEDSVHAMANEALGKARQAAQAAAAATNGVNGYHASTADDIKKLIDSSIIEPELPPPPPVKGRRTFADLRKTLDERAKQLTKQFVYDCLDRGELGCAELFYSVANGDVLYDQESDAWYWWNGLHWEEDCGNIFSLAGDILSSQYRQVAVEAYKAWLDLKTKYGNNPSEAEKAELVQLKAEQKDAVKKASDLYKLNHVKNVLVFSRGTELLGITGAEWDAQVNLLGVNNGVIDLATGLEVDPDPKQYIRTVAPVDYDPATQCPLWEKSILEIFNGDTELVRYVRRFLGYAMSGTCHESDFHVWFGKHGRNGKEFLLERIRSTLGGKLTGTVEAELLLKTPISKGKNGATPALMVLRGRRIAWASETNEGRTLDNAAMKDLSGGHYITGRGLHEKQAEWKRTHTLILLTNHKPHVGGGGGGAEWERIKLTPFTQSFVAEPDPTDPNQHKKDPTLGERIDRDELPGILNWLIAGCLEWRRQGLQPPAVVKAATSQYRTDEDTLGRFIDECCIVFVGARVEPNHLYQAYRKWCADNGDREMGSRTFGDKIEDRGFQRKPSNGRRYFFGIGLIAPIP
jgi:putative DNA primase/helicase